MYFSLEDRKIMMKRLLACLFIAVMAMMTFAACNDSGDDEPVSNGKDVSNVSNSLNGAD